jgi:hypothetical protein
LLQQHNHKETHLRFEKEITSIDKSLRKNKTPDDMVVYSGISASHGSKIKNNLVLHHPSYLSTSLSPLVAKSFAGGNDSTDILKIHVPKGHSGAYVGEISHHRAEREFVLPRGLTLRIHPDKQQTMIMPGDRDYTVHHATIEPIDHE